MYVIVRWTDYRDREEKQYTEFEDFVREQFSYKNIEDRLEATQRFSINLGLMLVRKGLLSHEELLRCIDPYNVWELENERPVS